MWCEVLKKTFTAVFTARIPSAAKESERRFRQFKGEWVS